MTHPARRTLAALLTLLASAMILVTLVTTYINHTFVNQHAFTDRATSVLRSESVDQLIVERVTDAVVPNATIASAIRPQLTTAVDAVVDSGPVTAAFRATANNLHSQLVSGNADELSLTVPGIGSALATRIEPVSPELADDVRGIGAVTIVRTSIPPAAVTAIHTTVTVSKRAGALLVLTVALIVLALVIGPERRRTVMRLGTGAVVSGLLVVGCYLLGHVLVTHAFSGQDAQTAAGALWSGYLSGIVLPGLLLAGGGAVVSVAAAIL